MCRLFHDRLALTLNAPGPQAVHCCKLLPTIQYQRLDGWKAGNMAYLPYVVMYMASDCVLSS